MSALDDLKKTAEVLNAQIENMKRAGQDTRAMEDALKRVQAAMTDVGTAAADSAVKVGRAFTPIEDQLAILMGSTNALVASLGRVGGAIFNTTNATMQYGDAFANAFKGSGIGEVIGGLDEVTGMSKEFRGEAIKMGSQFGESFEDIEKNYQNYAGATLLAQNSTYQTRAQIESQTQSLARMGIGLDDISKASIVAGTKQNMLSEGFLLSADSGLNASVVFEKMAIASRKMGLSIADSGAPILALESLAKSTGLPITELSDKVFNLAEQNARFGTTVESLSPIMRRFAAVLGDGFKGFAIKDAERLMQGLASQVGTTNAAFMAMQSGMASPGGGVAGAMMDFESAMAQPEEAIKMLSASLSSISGGKILKFEEAKGNAGAENQFMMQRKMLEQLTGINDPQQTRTLMALLSDQQSGKTLSVEQNKTLEEAMKSGSAKQEESKSLAEKIGKAQVGLLASIALSLSNSAANKIAPQTESAVTHSALEFISGGKNKAQDSISAFIDEKTSSIGDWLKANSPDGAKNTALNIEKSATNFISENKQNRLQAPETIIPGFNSGQIPIRIGGSEQRRQNIQEIAPQTSIIPEMGQSYRSGQLNLPQQIRPAPSFSAIPPTSNLSNSPATTTQITMPAGASKEQHVVVTFRGTDELSRMIASIATVHYNNTAHGNG